MDELDLTEKTPRIFDDDDLRDEVPHLAAVTPARTARGTKSYAPMAFAPPPIPRSRRAATVRPMIGSATVPPSKLIPFLPPPEPQSSVLSSAKVVGGPVTADPPPVPTTPHVRASSTVPHPSSVRHAGSVGPPTMTSGRDPASVGSRSTISDSAHGWIAPFAADEPHVAGTPMTDDKHVALPPIADAGEVTYHLDRSSARPRRSVAAIAGVAVGAALVLTTIGLMIRGSGTKPAAPPAPMHATLATAGDSPTPTTPTLPTTALPTTALAAPVAPAPAPLEPAEDEPAHADLPITSQPDGAIVTLIANGDATVVGRTPITASVDPTLTYDVVLALRDHPTKITHIDASKVHELAIDLTPRPTPPPRRRAKIVTATKPASTKPVATKLAPKPVTKPAPRTR